MRRLVTTVLTCLLAFPAHAFSPGQQVIALNPQVAPSPIGTVPFSQDYTLGGFPVTGGLCGSFGHQVPCKNSLTRASVAYQDDLGGTWYSFASGVQRLTNKGALIEEVRTNDALWARDLTQSGTWIAVGTGAALNAVGIDNTANSATTLTANGTASSCTASCTILQTITLGSTADTYSVFLKRVTGSGTVNITINNLAGVTACTLTTSAFTRCSVTATLANPVIGIQMTAVGDVIVADFNQLEPGSSVTSPILTTNATVNRAADVTTQTNPPTFGVVYALAAKGTPTAPNTYALTQPILSVDDGTNTNRQQLFRPAASGTIQSFMANASGSISVGSRVVTANASHKIAGIFAVADVANAVDGQATEENAATGLTGPVGTLVGIGKRADAGTFFDGYVALTNIWPANRIPNASLQTWGAAQ